MSLDKHTGMDVLEKIRHRKWIVKDEPGVLMEVQKEKLQIDKEYQREIIEDKVYKIAREWSWVAFGALRVALRDGDEFWLVDGQHRHAAAMRRPEISTLPCIVFEMDDVKREAQSFLDANTNRKALRKTDKFHAMLVTEDPIALRVNKLIRASGREISNTSRPNTIACVGELLVQMTRNPDVLERIWPVILKLCKGERMHRRIVSALCYIEANIGDEETISTGKWKKRLIAIGVDRLLDGAAEASAYYHFGGNKVWAKGMLKEINFRVKQKLELANDD